MGKNLPASEGDMGLIPGPGRSLEEGNSNPLRYSCLENPMDEGAWRATVHGVAKKVTCQLLGLLKEGTSLLVVGGMQEKVDEI